MKAYISALLVFSLLLLCSCQSENKGTKIEAPSSAASIVNTVSYLDLETSQLLKDYRYKDNLYFEATSNSAATINYTAAKSGDKKYIKYVTDDETYVYIADGTDFYLLNEDEKTAKRIVGIPSSHYNLLCVFDAEYLDRFLKTGTETIDGKEYDFETFNTDGGYCKFILDEDNNPIYLYNWYTTDVVIKVDFTKINDQPDEALFSIPDGYKIVTE